MQAALKKILRYIGRKDWDHVGTYTDEGISGSLEAADREDLKRLMADAHRQPKPFDIVVVSEGRAIGRVGGRSGDGYGPWKTSASTWA